MTKIKTSIESHFSPQFVFKCQENVPFLKTNFNKKKKKKRMIYINIESWVKRNETQLTEGRLSSPNVMDWKWVIYNNLFLENLTVDLKNVVCLVI